ncbi:MAG: primosomal protein N', partial [Planctomycetota bacterium]|nr:primosomal protein N' [Planctomycetota bacterium]
GRYALVRLPHRVRGLPMPTVRIVELRQDITPGRVELLGRTLTQRIAATLDVQRQVILLMNRRGFASFVFCPHCKWEFTCESCSRAMVFHQATQLVMCHYCQHTEALPEACPACKGKLLLFGMGIQRIEGELVRKFPTARFARMDSDTMTSPGQFEKVFNAFAAGEIDILLGTQMVGKGLDFPKVNLVGVVSADTSLSIPDFRASERTFQLVVQVAGRAGRGDTPGEVIVQTLHPSEPAIQLAVKHDYDAFAAGELTQRRATKLPPFTRIVRFVVRHEQSVRAEEGAAQLATALRSLLPRSVDIQGSMPAGVRKIRDQFRFHVVATCDEPGLIQTVLYPHLSSLSRDIHAEIIADADPLNMV